MNAGSLMMPEVDKEAATLIATLQLTEQRLADLTGGEVDAGMDSEGNAHLLRHAQAEMRDSGVSRLAGILNALPAHIALLDAGGTIVAVNETWRRFAAGAQVLAPGAGVGMNYLELCDRARGDSSAEARAAAAGIRTVLAGVTSFSIEYSCHSGTARRWLVMTATQLANGPLPGAVVMHMDVSERKEAESAMRESNAKFHQLADNITDAFWIRSPDYRELHYVSPAFETIWGRSVDSLMRDPHQWKQFIHPEDRGQVGAAFDALSDRTPTLDINYRIVRPNGEIRWVRVRGFHVPSTRGQPARHLGIVTDITNWRLTTDAMQKSDADFRALAESMPQMVWIRGPDGRNTWFSRQWMSYTGMSLEQSLGHGWMKPFHPEDRERSRSAWNTATATCGIYSIECRLRRADGAYRWWLARGVPQRDPVGNIVQWFGTCTDIHEIKLAEENLRQREALLRIAGRTAQMGGWAVELPGHRITWSEGVCAILDVPPGTVPTLRQALGFYAPSSIGHITEALRACCDEGTPFDIEAEVITAAGRSLWARCTGEVRRDAAGAISGVHGAFQDITPRKKMEEQLRQAQKMEAVGTLAGGIAHDFNNILAAINGYTELSRMILKDNPEVREHLAAVLQAAGRATDLVRQILAFSRQQPLQRRPLQLMPIISEAIQLLRAIIPSNIEFETLLPTTAPAVLADAGQIHQILMNLGTNAWHSMKEGPGLMRFTLERWVVDGNAAASQPRLRPGTYARVSVSDTGAGMDAATLKRIFEPFFTTKPLGEGTGLGLAVVHGIMDTHEGAVAVHSEPGKGTVFRLYFPALSPEPDAEALDASPVALGRGERILFVDDEDLLVRLGEKALGALGYGVQCVTDPTAALEMFREDPNGFSLIVTDQTMPRMSGLALADAAHVIRPGIPVILTTGYNHSLTPDRIKEAGLAQLLLKPFTIQSLGAAVHAALSGRGKAPESIYDTNTPDR